MNVHKLSHRLETVASFIPKGSKIADIGSDHAYLPCFAIEKEIASFAIAGEVVDGPYQSALNQVKASELDEKVSVRKGNGLEVISQGEVDCITIAGMGGTLIATILENGKQKLEGVNRLVLQPNVSAISIRKWLLDHGWELVAEKILEEDKKIYEVLVAERGNTRKPYSNMENELLLGPFLIKEKSDVFIKKWTQEADQWKKIYAQMKDAEQNDELKKKRSVIERKIKIVEEVLQK
ncbi:tRNA (adenine22-N1)-methyltransferase [Bacillus pakistanensis]|uniref:tRNA (Adenine22-N1)-methyltransferase n=1 Tax=Rossellomorea pakistanensis TaxID=992288 RepID=A0ABS2NA33_9BACI|nr:tRNA (adenine(22)-N(1))-methyltransferase TrmK [Bacillus pakistanensis]MBM7584706.1 tRNA (adenine22-N1)-methyltransferase [Bacillus pakistanensis]